LKDIGQAYNERLKRKGIGLPSDEAQINAIIAKWDEPWTPERGYQELKKRWYFHGSSWYMRQAKLKRVMTKEEMDAGCNGYRGCIEECPFFPAEGTLDPEDLQLNIQSLTEYLQNEKEACPMCQKGEPYEQHKHE
jgi:hypothetical protein